MRPTSSLAGSLPRLAILAAAAALALPAVSVAQGAGTGGPSSDGGVMAPSRAHNPVSRTQGGAAVTAPSGESPRARSVRCNREAARRHLSGAAHQEFRLSCLATAAPASHAGTQHKLPTPTKQIKPLGVATPPQPH